MFGPSGFQCDSHDIEVKISAVSTMTIFADDTTVTESVAESLDSSS